MADRKTVESGGWHWRANEKPPGLRTARMDDFARDGLRILGRVFYLYNAISGRWRRCILNPWTDSGGLILPIKNGKVWVRDGEIDMKEMSDWQAVNNCLPNTKKIRL